MSIRVVSLVPSVTESLLEWGIEPVACTRFCEQPELRHVGGTKDPAIDDIVALAPDLVVVDREENRREDAEALSHHGLRVVDLHVTGLASAVAETARLATVVGAHFDHAPIPGNAGPKIRAFVPIWRRPWMTIGADTYGASLLDSIGIAVWHGESSETYPQLTEDELGLFAERDGVRVALLPTEPYSFAERHFNEVMRITRIGDVRIIDGRDLFWWGVRTMGARERLVAALGDLLG